MLFLKIIAKSSCDIEQLNDRVKKGFNDIEIQLMGDFFNSKSQSQYRQILSKRWDIQNIHMPFIANKVDLPLEYIGNPDYSRVFLNVCHLAQSCAEYYGHRVNIVIHTKIPLNVMRNLPDALEKVKEFLAIGSNYAKDVNFSIENGALITISDNDIRINASSFDNNVQWAHHLNEMVLPNTFFTTLDTCHALMTHKDTEVLMCDNRFVKLEKNLGWFFKQNQKTVNNIHLCNMRGIGLGKEHGDTFYESNLEDLMMLDTICELYRLNGLNCNITLEVNEADYTNIKKAPALKELILKRHSDIFGA